MGGFLPFRGCAISMEGIDAVFREECTAFQRNLQVEVSSPEGSFFMYVKSLSRYPARALARRIHSRVKATRGASCEAILSLISLEHSLEKSNGGKGER